jgi:DNA (cytosine-5)-methyltransferase 1
MLKPRPKVIDLFAGVGGLSLGASRAGFEVVSAVEIDKHAFAAHKINFPNAVHLDKDVKDLSGKELLETVGLKKSELAGLIGGPPCQGFSVMGRQDIDDPRNSLFSVFFKLVSETLPAFFLVENVPGILAERNKLLRDAAFSQIPKIYKLLDPIVIKANEYGAPTTRTRIFFIGYDPKRLNHLSKESFRPRDHIRITTVGQALMGIPSLGTTWEHKEGWQAVIKADNSYFGIRVKAHIPHGVGDPRSIEKFENQNLVSGFFSTEHTASTVERFNNLLAGKLDKISKSVRLDTNAFCPTLRAGTGPEKGSYQSVRPVHPTLPRVICPREAARLQGFPDWFQFDKTKWHAFRQIGNSVSPLVAEEILSKILGSLKSN